jgi:hypothetical protein
VRPDKRTLKTSVEGRSTGRLDLGFEPNMAAMAE